MDVTGKIRCLLMFSCFASSTAMAADGGAAGDPPLSIAKLTEKIRRASRELDERFREVPDDVTSVILLGRVAVGKGTLLHALAGRQLVARKGRAAMELDVAEGQGLPGIRVGSGLGTTEPASWYHEESRLLYWDVPGFMDPRGDDERIINACALDDILKRSTRVKVLLVVNSSEITQARMVGINSGLDRIRGLFRDDSRILERLYLVVRRTMDDFSPQEMLEGAQGNMRQDGLPDHPLVTSLIRSAPSRTFSFPQPSLRDVGQNYVFEERDTLIEALRSPPIVNPHVFIHFDGDSGLRARGIMDEFWHRMNRSILLLTEYMKRGYWSTAEIKYELSQRQTQARHDKRTTEGLEALQAEERDYLVRLRAFIARLGTLDTREGETAVVEVLRGADFLSSNINGHPEFQRVVENVPFGYRFSDKLQRSNLDGTDEFSTLLREPLSKMAEELKELLNTQERAHVSYRTDISLVWDEPSGIEQTLSTFKKIGKVVEVTKDVAVGAAVCGAGGAVTGGLTGGFVGTLAGVVTAAISSLEDGLNKDNVEKGLQYCREKLEAMLPQPGAHVDPILADRIATIKLILEAIKLALTGIDKIDDVHVKYAVKAVLGAVIGVAAAYGGAEAGRWITSWLGEGPYAKAIQEAARYGGGAGGAAGSALASLDEATGGGVSGAIALATTTVPVVGPLMACIAAIPDKRVKAIAMGGGSGVLFGGLSGGVVGMWKGACAGYSDPLVWARDQERELVDSRNHKDFALFLKYVCLDGIERKEEVTSTIKVAFRRGGPCHTPSPFQLPRSYGKYLVDLFGENLEGEDFRVDGRLVIEERNMGAPLAGLSPYVTVYYPSLRVDFASVRQVVRALVEERVYELYKNKEQEPNTGNGLIVSMEILRRLQDVGVRFPLPIFTAEDLLLPPLTLTQSIAAPLRRTYEEIEASPVEERQEFIDGRERYTVKLTSDHRVQAADLVAHFEELKRRVLGEELLARYNKAANGSHLWLF